MPFASCVGVEYECTAVGIRDEEVLLKQESKFTTRDPIFDEENLYCLKLYEKILKRLLYYFLSKILSEIISYVYKSTVFENHRKSLIQHCERSELCLQKFIKNAKNGPFWRVFENLKLGV